MEYYFSAIDAPQSICLLRAMLLNLFMTVHYGLYVSIFSSRQEIITFAMVIFFLLQLNYHYIIHIGYILHICCRANFEVRKLLTDHNVINVFYVYSISFTFGSILFRIYTGWSVICT